MNFLKDIKTKVFLYDGSKGFIFQSLGLKGGEIAESWNLSNPGHVRQVYASYKEAGSDIIQTNTLQANRVKLAENGLENKIVDINREGVRLAREVMGKNGLVAASVGPLGKLLEPFGDMTFDEAYKCFKEQVEILEEAGADIIHFETFSDLAEMRIALLAAKENTSLPVICTMVFESSGRTMMGTEPEVVAIVLSSMGADAVGANCSTGCADMLEVIKKMSKCGNIALCAKPNAGLPSLVDGKTVYSEGPEVLAGMSEDFIKYGVRVIGGCCGAVPEHIAALKKAVKSIEVKNSHNPGVRCITSASSFTELEDFSSKNIYNMAELVKSASLDDDDIFDAVMDASDMEFDILYVNLNKIINKDISIEKFIQNVQTYIKKPMIFKSKDPDVLDKALKYYNGKAGVSIKGYSAEQTALLLPVAKKYGSLIY